MTGKQLINLIESHDVRREYKINRSIDEVLFLCAKCNVWKSFVNFSRDNKPSLVIPYRNDCKSCQTKHITKYYRDNDGLRAEKNVKDYERKKAKRKTNI